MGAGLANTVTVIVAALVQPAPVEAITEWVVVVAGDAVYELIVAPAMAVVPLYHCQEVPVPDDSVSVTLPPAQKEMGPLGVITGMGSGATVTDIVAPPEQPAVLARLSE